ncbi:MAG: MFS transporter [Christensenellales bacterium]
MKAERANKNKFGTWFKTKTQHITATMVRFSAIEFFFWMAMASQSFIAVFLHDQGLTATAVGTLMGIVNISSIVGPPIAGILSDKLRSTKRVLMLCITGASVFHALAPTSVPITVLGLSMVFLALPVSAMFRYPTMHLLDSWLVQTTNDNPSMSYGIIRSAGSIGFAVSAIAYTQILNANGGNTVFTFYTMGAINIILLVICTFQHDKKVERVRLKLKDMQISRLFKNYYYVTMLFMNLVMYLSISGSFTFISYLLRDINGNANDLGTIMGAKALFEVPLLASSMFLMRKFGLIKPIMFCALGFALENFLYIFCSSTLQVLLALLLHGMSFGLYIACVIRYISKLAPKGLAATAQTINGAMGALAGVLCNVMGGRIVDAVGIRGFFVVLSSVLLAGFILFAISFALGKKLGKPLPEGISEV